MSLSQLGYFQKLRLEFIEYRLEYFSTVSRKYLMQQFEIGPASASRDLAIYIESAPNNLTLKHETKQYFRSNSFVPLFRHEPQQVINSLINGFTGITSEKMPQGNYVIDLREIKDCSIPTLGKISRHMHTDELIETNGESHIINNICLSESGDLFVTTTNSRSGVEETRNIKDIIIS